MWVHLRGLGKGVRKCPSEAEAQVEKGTSHLRDLARTETFCVLPTPPPRKGREPTARERIRARHKSAERLYLNVTRTLLTQ